MKSVGRSFQGFIDLSCDGGGIDGETLKARGGGGTV